MMFYIIANKAVYTHTHKLENGTYLVHAHPYDKSEDQHPENQHQHHSGYEFLSIGSLDSFIPFVQIEFNIPVFLNIDREIFFNEKEFVYLNYLFFLNNKSPPIIEFN